jgi:PhnB protein
MHKTSSPPSNLPAGWHTLTPRLVVDDPRGQLEFLRRVFGARGDYQEGRPTIVRIGDSVLMISPSALRNAATNFLHVYVDDAASVHAIAIAEGAMSIEAPFTTPYGEERCMFKDPWGNLWQAAVFASPSAST